MMKLLYAWIHHARLLANGVNAFSQTASWFCRTNPVAAVPDVSPQRGAHLLKEAEIIYRFVGKHAAKHAV